MKPGVYEISHADYHADPCPSPSLSASIGKLMLERSPLYAWHRHPRLGMTADDKAALPRSRASSKVRQICLGQAAHAVILEGSWDGIDVVEADSFRSKVAREIRDVALGAGRTPILEAEAETVRQMKVALEGNSWLREFLQGARERTAIWKDGDAWVRIRPDIFNNNGPRFVADFKTTALAATGDGWGRRQIWENSMQVGLYRSVIGALFGPPYPPFKFVVQEVEPPYAAGLFEFPPEAYEFADRIAARAAALWKQCIESDFWPSYEPGLIVPDAPYWMREALADPSADDSIKESRE